MRIDKLSVKNFRLFEEQEFSFHPQFNLIVGVNGSGKSSLLRALVLSMKRFMDDLTGNSTECQLVDDDVICKLVVDSSGELREERFVPVSIMVSGETCFFEKETLDPSLLDFDVPELPRFNSFFWQYDYWERYEKTHASDEILGDSEEEIQKNWPLDENFTAPLIVFYGCSRTWLIKESSNLEAVMQAKVSRVDGYKKCMDAKVDNLDWTLWLIKQDLVELQKKRMTLGKKILNKALAICFEDFKSIEFSISSADIVICRHKKPDSLFKHISDGQRCMIGLIGDMVRRAVLLNPQLGDEILEKTAGVVLIDELDLHLHPTWQRRIIDDLRKTFPQVQFICTTHSPFLIQSLRSGDELLMLDGQPTAQLANKNLEEIAQGIMGVEHPEVAAHYMEMKEVAKNYLELLDEAKLSPQDKLAEYKKRLAEGIAPYADNPAFQAFLEMKRAVKLGE